MAAEIEGNPVSAGWLGVEFEHPAGAGVELDFPHFADAVGLAQPQRGGGEGGESGAVFGVERVLADQARELREITRFEGLGDLCGELRGVCCGSEDRGSGAGRARISRRGGRGSFVSFRDFRQRRSCRGNLGRHTRPGDQDDQRGGGDDRREAEEKIGKLGSLHEGLGVERGGRKWRIIPAAEVPVN